jgi:hypothetical protein
VLAAAVAVAGLRRCICWQVMDHTTRAVLGQTGVDTTSNEISQFGRCWTAWT